MLYYIISMHFCYQNVLHFQVLRAQNRIQTNGNGSDTRRSGDFSALQTQLAEAERGAERAHMEGN